ncbi:hypothetical protein VNO77_05587 [Canavalia gladiata]|uniref:Desiccation-related protein PCC13-62 n=1 Tax=Canavalia gladiata TaxID=3824 RepID=A0AAN9N4C5_CANGL
MTLHISSIGVFLTLLLLPFLIERCYSFEINASQGQAPKFSRNDLLEFSLNLEFLEAELFLNGATGKGLDSVAPSLAQGGPPPVGGKLAKLDPLAKDVIYQFALQEVGHIRAIKSVVRGPFPRPLINISIGVFAEVMDAAFGRPLLPSFDPYANSINFFLASYVIPYVGLTGYVGLAEQLQDSLAKRLVASLLGVESGQDAVIRTFLYERKGEVVVPYNVTVAEFTNRISELRNRLGNKGTKDEGLVVPQSQGAEGKVSGNILAADNDSLSFARTPEEILRIVYGNGNERVAGGYFPNGGNGRIASYYLRRAT